METFHIRVFSPHVLDSPSIAPLHPENDSELTITVDSVLNKPSFKHIEAGVDLYTVLFLF